MPTTRFTKEHEWIRVDGQTGTIGITDYAQKQLGDIVFVELPTIGTVFKQGAQVAVVESVKAASDVYAPIAGEVVAANDALTGTPEALNEDAYGAWLFKVRPADANALAGMLDAAAYEKLIG